VRVIGVDLAWGRRAWTGLCAVEGGRVLDSDRVRDDDALDAWIAGRAASPLLLAIDAPLVVENAAGRRPCEDVLSRAYGARHAGPYPANRAMPAFADGGRARALARRLGASVDPHGPAAVVAIEVYPHTALVSLFGLATRLGYKAKAGRSVGERRAAFDALLARLRALTGLEPPLDVTTSPRWPALEAAVKAATTAAALDAVEDELDAYVCAYAGLYHLAWRGVRSLVVGDVARGYVVTPVDVEAAAALRRHAARSGVPVS
jgi:predicted RNase H-like nuclease